MERSGGGKSNRIHVTLDLANRRYLTALKALTDLRRLAPGALVVSASNTENVKLTASSDPEGLDLSVAPDTLPPNNEEALPILIVKPRADTLPRDYLVTVTATSGDVSANTSFIVSLTCNSPFISSLSTSQPQSQSINAGQTATLSVTGIGTGPFRYQWYVGHSGATGFPITGGNTATLTTPPITTETEFWVRVSNPCGSRDSATAVVTPR